MHGIANSNKNRQTVLSSVILAKAIVRMPNGRINILVVFNQSTRHEFYWSFQARSPRSARKSWRPVCPFNRDFNTDLKPYNDFQSFVAYYARTKGATVLTVRVLHVRQLATVRAKTAHESIHADWTPRTEVVTESMVRKVNLAFQRNIKGRDIGWS